MDVPIEAQPYDEPTSINQIITTLKDSYQVNGRFRDRCNLPHALFASPTSSAPSARTFDSEKY